MKYKQPESHIDFILHPASDLIREVVVATNALGCGIKTYPICEYLLPSAFLQLAGAQEQKLKCICWELANRDYAYRYERFERHPYSECSSYEDKCQVYKDLIEQIMALDPSYEIKSDYKDKILSDWRTSFNALFNDSTIAKSFLVKYKLCLGLISKIKANWMMEKTQLFVKKDSIPRAEVAGTNGKGLYDLFRETYDERNRCAHNTRSYQHNLPSIMKLENADASTDNYFVYISILLLLDRIYVGLFKDYLERL